MAFIPVRPVHSIDVHVEFRDRVASNAWILDGVLPVNALLRPEHNPEAIFADGVVSASFQQPYLGLIYGVAWRWADIGAGPPDSIPPTESDSTSRTSRCQRTSQDVPWARQSARWGEQPSVQGAGEQVLEIGEGPHERGLIPGGGVGHRVAVLRARIDLVAGGQPGVG